VVTNTYHNGAVGGNFVIDDYQVETSADTSSSGGGVTYTVENLTEDRLDDNNTDYFWTVTDPMNGMIHASSTDSSRGVVFDWTGSDRYYEWEIIPARQDFTGYEYLSFRAGQGTRHPNTTAVLGDLFLSVSLRDGSAVSSTINIGAYGGGLEQPYQRSGGWHNELETIRIRLTDFLTNGSGLDLTGIIAVRLDCGPSYGSDEGRIGVDNMELTKDIPAAYIPVTMILPSGPPEYIAPGSFTLIDVEIYKGDDNLVPGSEFLYYRFDGGIFIGVPLVLLSSTKYQAELPPAVCTDTPEFYFSAEGVVSGIVTLPVNAPAIYYSAAVGKATVIIEDDFESDKGWSVWDDPSLTDGSWERGVPAGGGGRGDPVND